MRGMRVTMQWHVLTSTNFDFDEIAAKASGDRHPRHLVPELAQALNAEVHQPNAGTAGVLDRLGALIYGRPEHWALARDVRSQLEPGHGVYAGGDDIGFVLLLLCVIGRNRSVRFVVACTNPKRFRTRLIGWFLVLVGMRWIMPVPSRRMADAAGDDFGRLLPSIVAMGTQIDTEFFRPLDPRPVNRPPLILSCGAEQRDYELLARATADLDVEVKVCFASPNLSSNTRFTMPSPVPDNMEIRGFDFIELRDLYQRADLVAVPLLDNEYAAGLTTVFEATACEAPVVVARSYGVVEDMAAANLVSWYQSGDGNGLRAAIEKILADPESSRERARRANQYLRSNYSTAAYLRRLLDSIPDPTTARHP